MMYDGKLTGERLRTIRMSLEIKQNEMAQLGEIGQGAYSQQELGNSVPNARQIFNYAERLGVSSDYLLGLTDVQNPAPHAIELQERPKRDKVKTSKQGRRSIPQPETIAAHETDGAEPVTQERMEEIIKQAYQLIVARDQSKGD